MTVGSSCTSTNRTLAGGGPDYCPVHREVDPRDPSDRARGHGPHPRPSDPSVLSSPEPRVPRPRHHQPLGLISVSGETPSWTGPRGRGPSSFP